MGAGFRVSGFILVSGRHFGAPVAELLRTSGNYP